MAFGSGFRSTEPCKKRCHVELHYEGLPIVLLEAMSYGLPMLLSDIPAHKEIRLAPARYFKDATELATKLAVPTMLNGEQEKYQAK